MKFQIDHDYHIHSCLSLCSNDPEQTPERILAYGREKGLRRLCLTDHYWDERIPGMEDFFFYRDQNTARVRASLPLPVDEDCELLFGCETDMSYDLRIGITRERWEEFDFIMPAEDVEFKDIFALFNDFYKEQNNGQSPSDNHIAVLAQVLQELEGEAK